jgi:tellurite resistance protein TerC
MKKVFVAIAGGTVLLIGLLMVILPGPAILVIPLGIGILATEFAWARACKDKFQCKFDEWRQRRRNTARKTSLNNRPLSSVE